MTEYREKLHNLQWPPARHALTGQQSNKRGQPLRARDSIRCAYLWSLAGVESLPMPHQARSDHQPSALSPRGSIGFRTAPTLTKS